MTDGPATVLVVIVSRDTRDATLRCARSVLAQELPADLRLRVGVADNASTDGTADALRAVPGVETIAHGENRGFGRACNDGAARVPDAAAYVFLNADTELRPGALARLLAALRDDRDAAIAGPRFVFEDGRAQPSVRGDPTPAALLFQHTVARFVRYGAASHRAYKDPLGGAPAPEAPPRAVPVTLGACILVRGADFRALAGFDAARYFLYFEDADLCRRARDAGRSVLHVPAALVVHAGGASSDRHRERALTWYLRSSFLYVDRFHGRPRGLLHRAVFKPLFLLKLPADALRDLFGLLRGRRGKAAELGLTARFLVRGLWSFLLA